MRIAAKALLNLSMHDRNVKLKVIASLGDDLRKIHKNEYDAQVQSYLQLILSNKETF